MKKSKNKILFYIGVAVLAVGIAALVTAIVLELIGKTDLYKTMGIIAAICGPVAILLLILQLMFFGGADSPQPKNQNIQTIRKSEKDIPIVDVKEVEKSQDEIMYEKYVDLYNKKIISKEDLEKKRKELLGK